MYCRSCGKIIPRGAKFCRYCGFQFAPASSSVPKHQDEPSVREDPAETAAGRNISERRSSGNRTGTRKKKKAGVRAIAIVLTAAILFTGFVKPGFFGKKNGGGETVSSAHTGAGTAPVKKIKVRKTSEKETLSSERLTAALPESGVKIALTEYVFDDGQEEKLKVESMDPVYADNGDYVIKPYHIDLGDIHELDDFVTIRIPYDTTFCDDGEDPADCVGGVWRNPETDEWEETLYTIDAEAGEVVIETDHFSDFGAMTVKNKGRRDAILAGGDPEDFLGGEDLNCLTDAQAISAMRAMCSEQTADTTSSRLAGNQVLQAAMSLGGAVSDVNDAAGAGFSIAYFLDLTDNAMTGNYFHYNGDTNYLDYVPGPYADPSVTYTNRSFNIYNNDLMKKSGEVLSRVGTAVSACKLAYLAGKAAMGEAEDSDIFSLYKECASMAVTLSGSATLSALMAPVMLADQFISYMFTESMAIKETQTQEMYVWFNEKYPGTGAPYYTRKGRSAADWRKRIIQLIKENPEADTAGLLENEIDDFCNDFWELGFDEMGEVAAQCPKDIKRITDTDRKMRDRITDAYKKDLYELLNQAVMPAVREYFNKKMLKEAQKSIAKAREFYNQEIVFDILEPDRTDAAGRKAEEADSVYGGYRCCFVPLSEGADISNWSSTLPEKNVGLRGSFTIIGHIMAGKPSQVAVYEPDADITKAEPVLVVPFTLDGNNYARIILEKPQTADLSEFEGSWYETFSGAEMEIETFADGRIGLYNYGGIKDWIYADYTEEPEGSVVRVWGQDYVLDDATWRFIRLKQVECASFDMPSDMDYFIAVDSAAGRLITIFGTQADGYTRERQAETEPYTGSAEEYYLSPVIPPGEE